MTPAEEKLYDLNKQIENINYEKEKVQKERIEELLAIYSELIKNDTNNLSRIILSNFLSDIKNLYRI